jgi:hypothetical protein
MAAGDTALSICSDALQMLGAKAISSFTEGTDEANVSDSLYPDVKKQTLLIYPWSFVYKKTQISKLLTTPTTEYKYQFQLPGDRIGPPRSVTTSATPGANTIRDYRIFGDKLLTNEETIFIDYPYDVAEYDMPVYMVQLLKYMMAWHLAMPITDQVEKAQYWQGVAVGSADQNGRGGYTRIAMNMDGSGQPNFVIQEFPLVDVRF